MVPVCLHGRMSLSCVLTVARETGYSIIGKAVRCSVPALLSGCGSKQLIMYDVCFPMRVDSWRKSQCNVYSVPFSFLYLLQLYMVLCGLIKYAVTYKYKKFSWKDMI